MLTRLSAVAQRPVILLVAAIAATAGWRLFAVWDVGGLIGTDGGAYLMQWYNLTTAGGIAGLDIPSRTFLGPGWQLLPFVKVFGLEDGYRVWTALAPALVAPCAYILFRAIAPPKIALWAAIAVCFDWYLAQGMAAGILPYIALAPMLLIMAGMFRLREEPEPGNFGRTIASAWMVILGIPILAIMSMSQTGAAAFVIIPMWVIAIRPSWRALKRIAWVCAIGAVLAIPTAPHYLSSGPGSTPTLADTPTIFVVFGGFNGVVTVVAGIIVWLTWRAPVGIRACAIVAMSSSATAMVWSSNESLVNILFRSATPVPLLLTLPIAWCITRYIPPHWIWLAGMLAMLYVGMANPYLHYYQYSYSASMRPDLYEATNAIVEIEPQAIATNYRALAHWITGYSGNTIDSYWPRHRIKGSYPREDGHVAPCLIGWIPDCDPVEVAAEYGISHVLIDYYYFTWVEPTEYRPGPREAIWIDLRAFVGDWLVEEYRFGDAILYSVRS